MSLLLLLVIVLLILGVGSGPYMPYARNWGWGPSGLVWLIVIVAILFLLMGPVRF